MKWFASKDSKEDALEKLDSIAELIPRADVLEFFRKLTEAYSEAQATAREIAKIEAQKEIVYMEITRRYDLYHTIFNQLFDERKRAIQKSFDIIDDGLKKGDKELIGMGLKGLSEIVSASPFANLRELSNLLEGNRSIEI